MFTVAGFSEWSRLGPGESLAWIFSEYREHSVDIERAFGILNGRVEWPYNFTLSREYPVTQRICGAMDSSLRYSKQFDFFMQCDDQSSLEDFYWVKGGEEDEQ